MTTANFQAEVDLELEKAGIQAYFTEYLAVGRPAPPMTIYWKGQKRILSITCRDWEDERDKNKAIMEMLWMSPAIMSTTLVLAMIEPVALVGGIKRCIVMVTATVRGALSVVMPYEINDEDNTISFDDSPDLDPSGGGAYSEHLGHMLPIFAKMRRSVFSGADMVKYLSNKGHEIEFAEEENMSTISTYNL